VAYGLIVIAEIVFAILVDGKGFPSFEMGSHYSFNIYKYYHKWEFTALIATFLLVVIFWWDQGKSTLHFQKTWCYRVSNGSLLISLPFLIGAVATLHYTSLHFLFVFLLSLAFLASDGSTWHGVDTKSPWREQAKMFCLFSDAPIVGAFFCLGIFYLISLLSEPSDPLDTISYFIAGAIAFQWLASNFIFVVISWGNYLELWGSTVSGDVGTKGTSETDV